MAGVSASHAAELAHQPLAGLAVVSHLLLVLRAHQPLRGHRGAQRGPSRASIRVPPSTRKNPERGRKTPRGRPYLGAEGEGGGRGLMLGFLGAPGVVELEALVAEAGLALGAALGGLQLRGFAELAHDGGADVDGLAVTLHHPLQRQVAEEAAQTPFAQIHVPLASRAGEADGLGVHGAPLASRVCAEACKRETERASGRAQHPRAARPSRGDPARPRPHPLRPTHLISEGGRGGRAWGRPGVPGGGCGWRGWRRARRARRWGRSRGSRAAAAPRWRRRGRRCARRAGPAAACTSPCTPGRPAPAPCSSCWSGERGGSVTHC